MDKSESVAEIYAWLASRSLDYPYGIPEVDLAAEAPLEKKVSVSLAEDPYARSGVQILFAIAAPFSSEGSSGNSSEPVSAKELAFLKSAIEKGLELRLSDVAVVFIKAKDSIDGSSLIDGSKGSSSDSLTLDALCKKTEARFFVDCGGLIEGSALSWIVTPTLKQSLDEKEAKRSLWEGLKVIKSQLLDGRGS